jgi:hypothetical protein
MIELRLHGGFAPLADREFLLEAFDEQFEATDTGFELDGF